VADGRRGLGRIEKLGRGSPMKCKRCEKEMTPIEEKYHFTSSGLDYVYLSGIEYARCGECGEKSVRILNMKMLLEGIGEAVVTKKLTLEAQDIVFLRKGMGIKAKEMADILGVDTALYSRWENGHVLPGKANARLIRLVYAASKEVGNTEDIKKFFPPGDREFVRVILNGDVESEEFEFEEMVA
jgi:putative zinc finger/helix-turn-helix YgiT family protein